MPVSPTTVVFDVGNVLVRWKPEEFYLGILKDEGKVNQYMAKAHTVEWNVSLDRGEKDWDHAFEERVTAFPQWEEPLRAYQTRWIDTLRDVVNENVALLRRLAARGVPLYAITNFNGQTFGALRKHPDYDFLNLFEGAIVSGDEQLVKPDRAIYDLLCSRYDLAPQNCVFIDDSAANIAMARNCGMHGIHFVEPMDVAAELGKMGIGAVLA